MSIVDTLSMVPLLRLRHGDGVADAAEGVVAAVAAAGGDDEVVFAARDRERRFGRLRHRIRYPILIPTYPRCRV